MKRLFDILLSLIGLCLLFIPFIFISLLIAIDSRGGVLYKQVRVGKNGVDFNLFKFRSMVQGADRSGLLTIGERDSRITKIGYLLRKYKIDELPQLINVLIGTMSLVGPRPEVRKYVDLYSEEQQKVLSVKPGITDYASLEYCNENEILGKVENSEQMYITKIMPAKLKLNLQYIAEQNTFSDLKIIVKTIKKIYHSE